MRRRHSHNLQQEQNKDETLTDFNEKNSSIKFTIEKEQHNSINFLDPTICLKRNETRIRDIQKTYTNRYHNTQ
jgi:hypothetical protein